MPYTKVHEDWKDYPDVTTPLTATGLEQIEEGIQDAQDDIDAHLVDTTAAHDVTAIAGAASLALIIALG